jgi:parallel beta-helix repeat protein
MSIYTFDPQIVATFTGLERNKNVGLSLLHLTVLMIVLMMVIAPTTRAQNGIWYVATNGSDETGDGSEINPFATIQHGIDVASDGDTILAAPGIYTETISVFQKNDIHLEGSGAEVTTIDGGQNGHIVVFNLASGSIQGFTITNSGNNPGYSAGVFTSQATVSVLDNVIVHNNNGIVASSYSNITIQANHVISNTGLDAIQLMTESTGIIRNNVIAENTWHGIYGTPSTIINNTVANNGSFGICLVPEEEVIIRNNIIVNNSYGIFVLGGETSGVPLVEISYNDVWDNSSADYWEEFGSIPLPWPPLQPDDIISRPFEPQPGTGEIHGDPLFADSFYHLQLGSLCIDAGDPQDDFSNEPEPNGCRINQGAYGNTPEAEVSNTSWRKVYLPIVTR